MRIVGIGAGPAALYFSILMKKAHPSADITLYERNQPDDTFGWGVVFSDETLGGFELADRETYDEITRRFAYWTDMDTFYGGTCVRSTGHGFCGMSRKELLKVFHRRCRDLGVELEFGREVTDIDAIRADADLVLGADGVNSLVRDTYEEHFGPDIDWRQCKFTWLGTTLPLEAFTFIFRENEHGLFQVHAYPFEKNLSTFIVECHEDVWKRAGLDQASEADTVAYCHELFGDHLKGHELLTNKSVWRTFPTVKNATWHHENVVLMGDAAHTAHFSIGSGTKLAMEDAITLSEAFKNHGTGDVGKVLDVYEESRRIEVIKLQKAAQTSLEWFENSARYTNQHPVQFSFNLMTRSKRITYDNLRMRDPALVDATAAWFAQEARGEPAGSPPPAPIFNPFTVGNVELMNRVVVSPMCQYSAVDGAPTDWHFVHYGAMAVGGAALVMSEMTNVAEEARITYGCTGMYTDEHVAAWKRIIDFARANSHAKFGLQLGHAGRKGSCKLPWAGDVPLEDDTKWETIGPSTLPYAPDWPPPRAMTREDMDRVIAQYVQAGRARQASGLRRRRGAHGARVPAVDIPVPAGQPAQRRVRRRHREPSALSARGVPGRTRGVGRRPAPVRARHRDGRPRSARPAWSAGKVTRTSSSAAWASASDSSRGDSSNRIAASPSTASTGTAASSSVSATRRRPSTSRPDSTGSPPMRIAASPGSRADRVIAAWTGWPSIRVKGTTSPSRISRRPWPTGASTTTDSGAGGALIGTETAWRPSSVSTTTV